MFFSLNEILNTCYLKHLGAKIFEFAYFRESGAAVANDVSPGTKHSGTSVAPQFFSFDRTSELLIVDETVH